MALANMQNNAFNPLGLGLFGTNTIELQTNLGSYLIP